MINSFLLTFSLLLCALSQDLKFTPDSLRTIFQQEKIPKTSPISMFLRHHENVTYEVNNVREGLNCTDFNITDPENPMTKYLSNSGRSINDLGFFDSCKQIQKDPELMAMSPPFYVIFGVSFKGYPAKWGVCMPLYCYGQIYNTLNATIPENLNTQLKIVNANTMEDYDLSSWKSALMMCILAFFFLMGLLGSLVENSSIGDKDQFQDQPLLFGHNNSSQITSNLHSTVNNINATEINGTYQRSQASSVPPSSTSVPPPPLPRAQPVSPMDRKQWWAKFVMCFSISSNMKKFVTRGREQSPLDVLDGVRVLSIFWVILGHSYFYPIMTGNQIRNITDLNKFLSQFLFTVVTSGLLAVDTFFFMSAFLGAYIFLVKSPRKFSPRMILEVPIAYFHRYYRLTPLLAFIIYFAAYVLYPLSSGPSGNGVIYSIQNCDSYGWADLLYINNFYPKIDKVCEGQTWYLANDMQLFLILPWLMLLYRVHKFIGYIAISAVLVANLIVSFYVSWHYDLGIGLNEPDNFMQIFYGKPWVRATPYLVGILGGIFYYEYKEELKRAKQESTSEVIRYRGSFNYEMFDIATRSSFMSLVYFIIGVGITFTCVFVYYPYQKQGFDRDYWPLGARSTYNMLARGMFVFGLFLVLIPLLAGRFTMLRDLLGNTFFHVLAKSTYSVYLIHEVFLVIFGYSERSYQYFTHLDAIVIALSMIVLAYLVGSVFTLLIDSPLGNIDKTFIFPPKNKKKKLPPVKTIS